MWTERAERRQQLAAQKSSDSKQRHIHVQVLVIVCRDFFHSVLLSVVLRLLEAYHISLVNKVLPINSNVIPNHENREIWQKYTSTVITCVFFVRVSTGRARHTYRHGQRVRRMSSRHG